MRLAPGEDVTKLAPDKQLSKLERNRQRIMRQLSKAAKAGNTERMQRYAMYLSETKARMDVLMHKVDVEYRKQFVKPAQHNDKINALHYFKDA